jgi:hypothetical protein
MFLTTTRKALTVLCLVTLALAAPTAAMAVNVSSNDGSGVQNATAWLSGGIYMDGNLRSTHGNPVYYSGLIDFSQWWCDDVDDGRYTGNVTSTSGMNAGGAVQTASGACTVQGGKAKVCRDINNLPDSCGSWSALTKP